MNYKELLGIDKEINELSVEESIKLIREFHQIDLYTVDKDWCIQLFEIEVCPNDIGASCDWEGSNIELKEILKESIEYIAECIYQRQF